MTKEKKTKIKYDTKETCIPPWNITCRKKKKEHQIIYVILDRPDHLNYNSSSNVCSPFSFLKANYD